jgi:hypothetical protein
MSDLTPRGIGDNSKAALLDDLEKLLDFEKPTLDELEEEIGGLVLRRDELLGGVERCPEVIEDDDTGNRAADLARLIGAAISNSETRRLARNEPARQAQALVNSVYSRITTPLSQAKATVLGRLTTYQRAKAAAERERRLEEARRREEEARLARAAAREAEEKARTEAELNKAVVEAETADQATADAILAQQLAAVKPADLSRQRGDFGAVASLRQSWTFDITDLDGLDLDKLRPHIPKAALEQAIRSYIKAGGRSLRGAEIYQTAKTSVR